MQITQTQINEIKRRAKLNGISDQQVDALMPKLLQKFDSELKQQSGEVTVPAQAASNSAKVVTQPTSVAQNNQAQQILDTQSQISQTAQSASEKPGLLKSVRRTLIQPIIDYGKFVGEAAAQAGRYVTDKKFRQINKKVKNNEQLSEEDKTYLAGIKSTYLVDENKIDSRGDILKTGAKATAGAASYAVPAGVGIKGVSTGAKIVNAVASGALSGAMFGFSEGEDIDVDKIISGAAGGAAGAAVVPVAGAGIKKISAAGKGAYSKLVKRISENVSDTAAERIHKASPSMWQKAVEQHGIDLTELTKKVVGEASDMTEGGVSYDDLLGPVSKRGRGGILKSKIDAAESIISKSLKNVNKNTKFTIDEVVESLQTEKELLRKLPGNDKNIAALDEFINGFKAQYGKGITPKRALELKRIADSQFGRAVVDENTGSAVAQAQKMVANGLRKKLKKLIPEIGDALQTETEIYTIQPVLSRARATINTQGSEIRVGSLKGKGLFELIFSVPDVYLRDPERASKIIRRASAKSGEKLSSPSFSMLLPDLDISSSSLSSVPLRSFGAALGSKEEVESEDNIENNTSYPNQEQESGNINSETDQNNAPLNNNGNIIPQEPSLLEQYEALSAPKSAHPIPKFQQYSSKQEMVAAAFADGLDTKAVKELVTLWDEFAPEDDNQIETLIEKKKMYKDAGLSTASIDQQIQSLGFELIPESDEVDLSASEVNRVQLAESGLRALDEIEEILADGGEEVVLQNIPGRLGARQYDSAAFRAVEGLLRARSGAAIPESEVRRYMNANLPQPLDSEQARKAKLAAFRKDLQAIANTGQTGGNIDDLLDNL